MMVRMFSCGPIACWISAQTSSLVTWSLCEIHSLDFMQENPMLISIDKGDGSVGGGQYGKEEDMEERKRLPLFPSSMWDGDEGITNLKTNVISSAAKRKQCLLLGEACLAACCRGWAQHCGMTLLLKVFCLCSLQIQRCSVCTGTQGRGAERAGWIVFGN